MEYKEFKTKSKKDLERALSEKKENMRRLRFDLVSGKVKNISEMRKTRKEIAMIFTAINKK